MSSRQSRGSAEAKRMAAQLMMNALTRAVYWTAGVVEGLMSGLVRGVPGRGLALSSRRGDRSFGELRAALLGCHRRQIARVLGKPPTASVGPAGAAVAGDKPVTFWQASTWYYPFDHARRQAIAIRFVGDRARGVDFIGLPGVSRA